jgi:hypothetical protein
MFFTIAMRSSLRPQHVQGVADSARSSIMKVMHWRWIASYHRSDLVATTVCRICIETGETSAAHYRHEFAGMLRQSTDPSRSALPPGRVCPSFAHRRCAPVGDRR